MKRAILPFAIIGAILGILWIYGSPDSSEADQLEDAHRGEHATGAELAVRLSGDIAKPTGHTEQRSRVATRKSSPAACGTRVGLPGPPGRDMLIDQPSFCRLRRGRGCSWDSVSRWASAPSASSSVSGGFRRRGSLPRCGWITMVTCRRDFTAAVRARSGST